MNKIKIVIADDHPVFRRGLRMIISAEQNLEISGEAENGREALELIKATRPDVAVLDVNMPQCSGFEVVRELKSAHIDTGIIILTMHKDEATFNSAMDLGVKGYLLKESAVDDIVAGINAVAAGKNFVNSSISGFLFNRGNRKTEQIGENPRIADLTPSQLRVLKLVASELTSQQIAEELFISVRTVQRHRENICKRLGISGSHALLRFAMSNKESLL